MNPKKNILTILLLVVAMMLRAQSFTLSGKVSDEEGNAVELATISCLEQGAVTMANLKGEYSLKLQSADSVVIKYSMVGYQTRTRVLRRPKGNQRLLVTLHPMKALDEVVVTERRRQTTSTEQLDTKDLKRTPSTTGNAVEELVQQQAGVSTHNELSSQYNVRGGSFDENSVYINNVEVYRPLLIRSGQQEGLSVINSDMVEKIGFSSGGFEAKYGDKMSSTLDIQYRKPTRWEANLQASFLGASAFVGYGSKKFTMSHGIRYKTNRYLLGSLETKGEYRPNFLDYQTYITYSPNQRWNFDFIGNISENHYNFTPETRETSFGTMQNVKSFRVYFDGQEKDIFRTLFGTLRIQRIFSTNTKVSLLASAFHTKEQETYDIQGQYWLDDAQTQQQLGVGTYMEHARNYLTANVQSVKLMANHKTKKHDMEAGLTFKWEKIEEQAREYEMRDSSGYSIPHTGDRLDLIYSLASKNTLKSTRIEAYLQDTYRFQSKGEKPWYFTLNYGLRLANWSYNKETIVSPRVSLAAIPAFNENVTFRLATGLYYQAPFYKELRDTVTDELGITRIRLNKDLKAQRSVHVVLGGDYYFRAWGRPFKLTAEGYYKYIDRMESYTVDNVRVRYSGKNDSKGYAGGLDLKLYGELVPGADSWISFSTMVARQRFIGSDLWIPSPTEQRWNFSMLFQDYIPQLPQLKFHLRMQFAEGQPYYAPRNNQAWGRMPVYKRLDLGATYLFNAQTAKFMRKPSAKHVKQWAIQFEVFNLVGWRNVNSYFWVADAYGNQWASPNYLTGRRYNLKITVDLR